MRIGLDIDTYKTRFLGGSRQHLFYALLQFPDLIKVSNNTLGEASLGTVFGYGASSDFVPYLVKSTSTPESSFEEVQIPFPGHSFKMAGSRSYNNWVITFNLDEKSNLLEYFNKWHDIIYDPETKLTSEPDVYMKDQQLFLVDGTGAVIREYKLHNAWPMLIGASSLDYGVTDVATVDITFSFQSYKTNINIKETDLLKTIFNKITGSAMRV